MARVLNVQQVMKVLAKVDIYLTLAVAPHVPVGHPTWHPAWSIIDALLSSKYPALHTLKIYITFTTTVIHRLDFEDDKFNKETKKYLEGQFYQCRGSNRMVFDIDIDCVVEALDG